MIVNFLDYYFVLGLDFDLIYILKDNKFDFMICRVYSGGFMNEYWCECCGIYFKCILVDLELFFGDIVERI